VVRDADTSGVRTASAEFVLGLDLDGVVMDFYSALRPVAAEWLGVRESSLTPEVSFGLAEWGIGDDEYARLHRFAVHERNLFHTGPVIPGAAQSLRRLSEEGIRMRIITHRLCVHDCHRLAVRQTVEWLDSHAIPYWDLCFMKDKGETHADLYVDDAPHTIEDLQRRSRPVIAFTNSTNRSVSCELRADTWDEVEVLVRDAVLRRRARGRLRGLPSPRAGLRQQDAF
jgi:5'(3')-deoxyribonucleotidase